MPLFSASPSRPSFFAMFCITLIAWMPPSFTALGQQAVRRTESSGANRKMVAPLQPEVEIELRAGLVQAANEWRIRCGLPAVQHNAAWMKLIFAHGPEPSPESNRALAQLAPADRDLELVDWEIIEVPKGSEAKELFGKSRVLRREEVEQVVVLFAPGRRSETMRCAVFGFRLNPYGMDRTAWCAPCQKRMPLGDPQTNGSARWKCRDCGRMVALTAPDNQGTHRLVNRYLIGYQPPSRFPKGISRLEEMHAIWRGVWDHCRYVQDNRGNAALRREAFQIGPETMHRGVGDCDDMSVLLADWLLARGFEARVAIGKMDGGGHAWVVVREAGRTYLLEATAMPPASASRIYPLQDSELRYVPVLLFDRMHTWVWPEDGTPFNNDYWESRWTAYAAAEGVAPSVPTSDRALGNLWQHFKRIAPLQLNDYAWQATWQPSR